MNKNVCIILLIFLIIYLIYEISSNICDCFSLDNKVYCNPKLINPPQYCPGNIDCPNCGSNRCECPSSPGPPTPSPADAITIPIEHGGGYPHLKLYFHGNDSDNDNDNIDENFSELRFRLDTGSSYLIHGDYNSLNRKVYTDMNVIGSGWSAYCKLVEGPVYMKDVSNKTITSTIQFYAYDKTLGRTNGPPGGWNICGVRISPQRFNVEGNLLSNINYPYIEFNFNEKIGNIILHKDMPDDTESYKHDMIISPYVKIKANGLIKDGVNRNVNGLNLHLDTGSEFIAYTGVPDNTYLPEWVPNPPNFNNFTFNKDQIIQIVNDLCNGIKEEDKISQALKEWMNGLKINDDIESNVKPPGCTLTIAHYSTCWVFKTHIIHNDLYLAIKKLIGGENISQIPLSEKYHYRIFKALVNNDIQVSFEENNNNIILGSYGPLYIQCDGDLNFRRTNEICTGLATYYTNRVIWDTNNPNVIYIIPKQS